MCMICQAFRPVDPQCPYEDPTLAAVNLGEISIAAQIWQGAEPAISAPLEATKDLAWTGTDLNEAVAPRDSAPALRLENDDSAPAQDVAQDAAQNVAQNPVQNTPQNTPLSFAADTGGTTFTTAQAEGPISSLPIYSYDQIAFQLTDEGRPFLGSQRNAFDVGPGGTLTYNISALSAGGQQFAEIGLEAWSNVTGINFTATTGDAQLTFNQDASGEQAFANTAFDGSHIVFAIITISAAWIEDDWNDTDNSIELDSYSTQSFIHEIGHALGLAHAGDYNGDATFPSDALYQNDSWQSSIMSYFDQAENTTIGATRAYVMTPMIADIIAIHDLYGTPTDLRSGDTVYGVGSTAGGYLDQLIGLDDAVTATLYDNGGIDTLNLSVGSQGHRIDLNSEGISDVNGVIGGLLIARDTVIENVITGANSDRITGNSAANRIEAGDGADTINGGAGDDFLFGGSSARDLRDAIFGGEGNDNIDGGYGNDQLRGDAGNDTIIGGYGVDEIFGGSGDDELTGQAWSDLIFGGEGDDFINGGFGHDRVNGGAGSDRFFHIGNEGHGSDWIQDYTAAQGDVLMFGAAGNRSQFQVNFTETTDAGAAGVEEAFVIYRPTGQILWALIDGGAQGEINLLLAGVTYDLMA